MKWTYPILFLLVLAGCGGQRAQNLADADAGAQALVLMADERARPDAETIGHGVRGHLVAANGGDALPVPTMSPREIIPDPDAYSQRGAQAAQDAADGWLPWLTGAGVGLLAMAVQAARGAGGPWRLAADVIGAWLPDPSRRERERAERVRAALRTTAGTTAEAWDVLRQIRPDWAAELQRRAKDLQDRVGIRDEVRAVLDELLRPSGHPLAVDSDGIDTERMP